MNKYQTWSKNTLNDLPSPHSGVHWCSFLHPSYVNNSLIFIYNITRKIKLKIKTNHSSYCARADTLRLSGRSRGKYSFDGPIFLKEKQKKNLLGSRSNPSTCSLVSWDCFKNRGGVRVGTSLIKFFIHFES